MSVPEGTVLMDTRRKSDRVRKQKNSSMLDDLPDSVLDVTGMKKEDKLLQGWNPSDDSEDEYNPLEEKVSSRKRSEHHDSSDETLSAKKSRKNASSKQFSMSVKPDPSLTDTCVICHKDVMRSDKSITANLKFHYAQEHYYPGGSFSKIAPPEPCDLDKGQLLPRDVMGKIYRYNCKFQPCTQRRMGYKELVLHLATQHHQLETVMKHDNRPGINSVMEYLYPKESKGQANTEVRLKKEIHDNSEDVDDPSWSQEEEKRPVVEPKPIVKAATTRVGVGIPRVDKLHSCIFCNAKDGRNLNLGSGIQELRYHYSLCYYNKGVFRKFVDPGEENQDIEGRIIDEIGRKFKYKCSVSKCPKNLPRAKLTGFKEYTIHLGVAHYLVEKIMIEDMDNPSIVEVREAITAAREAEGEELKDIPPVHMEEVHSCLLCNGKDKEGTELSFDPNKLWQTRYHYASCYYRSGVYYSLYPPGKDNTGEDGEPRDVIGKEVKYCCKVTCSQKRKMGYKEFCIHMSTEHGGLKTVMEKDQREDVRRLVKRFYL